MPYARRKASGTRFRGVGQTGDAVFGRQVVAPPLNWDVTTVTTRALLDRVHECRSLSVQPLRRLLPI